MPGPVALVVVFALYCVTMFLLWSRTKHYRTQSRPRKEQSFALLEGQTILGVMMNKKKLYFLLGAEAEDIKDYE